VVYSETFSSKTEALKRELYLKRMKSRVYLEDLIRKSLQGSSAG
jgi:predicted GIY-YIG superfamily endonuclease